MNGQRGVLMSVYKTGGASTLDIVDRVKQVLADYASSLPESLHLRTFFDQSSLCALRFKESCAKRLSPLA